MEFVSTRDGAAPVSFSEAILQGLAPDGGLYVPRTWPNFGDPLTQDWAALTYPRFAERFLSPFLGDDPLVDRLAELCDDAFNFPFPLTPAGPDTVLVELFHGPTAAFKDFGARFLAGSLAALRWAEPDGTPLRILVATSGDTGAAVAAACHHRPGLEVGVLFPHGGVSPRQERQLTCWDDNVRSFAVHGTFDDCQALTKALFVAGDWPAGAHLTSANSINIGRLLPQAAYSARVSLLYWARHGAIPNIVVPSGNLGNVIGVFWARKLGFPIGSIAIATNANTVVPDWFQSGNWKPRRSRRTVANAMDVGDPSNMERLLHLYPDPSGLRRETTALSVSDETIRKVIARYDHRWGVTVCPHTATALHTREQFDSRHWMVFATAHPAKFDDVVEPLVGHEVAVPPSLAALLARPTTVVEVAPDLNAFKQAWA